MNSPSFFIDKDKKGTLCTITGDKDEILARIREHFEELDPSKADGAGEKHLPSVSTEGTIVTVRVGSIPHPMTEEHSIGWIYLETLHGEQIKFLCPDQEPMAQFAITADDKPVAAYAYCNLHGFWKTEL